MAGTNIIPVPIGEKVFIRAKTLRIDPTQERMLTVARIQESLLAEAHTQGKNDLGGACRQPTRLTRAFGAFNSVT